jgi:hypothetical protein
MLDFKIGFCILLLAELHHLGTGWGVLPHPAGSVVPIDCFDSNGVRIVGRRRGRVV